MKRWWNSRGRLLALGGGAALVAAVVLVCALSPRRHAVTPGAEALFTSTRYVTCLAAAPNGDLWAGTTGGLLLRTPDGRWRKFTRREGLPSNEIRGLNAEGPDVVVTLPTGQARRTGDRWTDAKRADGSGRPPILLGAASPASAAPNNQAAGSGEPPALPGATAEAAWHGRRVAATAAGLYLQSGAEWRQVALPPSSGTHITALLPHGDALWAAMFGDGVWVYEGRSWKPVDLNLPAAAREITALAAGRGAVWIGTRRAGLWELRGRAWTQHVQPGEPLGHNCQALAMYRGSLFVSTLEEGLAVRTPRGWGHFSAPQISSNAPRQMAVFRDRLYLRHGSGKLDCWDGSRWETNIGAALPRRQVSALAADSKRLYVAQWGGWSEYDGREWTHRLDLPGLQGLPVTALCPGEARLWIGTQSRGLAEYDRRSGHLLWHDERHGLPDDWVTALAPDGPTVAVGTFVGGLATSRTLPVAPARGSPSVGALAGAALLQNAAPWSEAPELAMQNVTALGPDGAGGLLIATRNGVWHKTAAGPVGRIEPSSGFLDREAQCLCRVPGGVWIGMRTGLFFVPHAAIGCPSTLTLSATNSP